jgi:PAS domain S-box-containing protein
MDEGKRFERAFHDAAIGIALLSVSPPGQYLEVNPTFCRMTGYSQEELLARDFQSITASEDIDKNLEGLQTLLDGQIGSLRLEKRYIRKDGSSFWARLHVSVVRDDQKQPASVLVQIEDIDERKRAEDALRKEERRLLQLVEQIPAVLWTTDTELTFTLSVGAGLAGLGLQPNQVVGTSLYDFFQTEDPATLPIQASLRALQGESVTFQTTWNDRLFQSHVDPLRDASGQTIGVIGFALDITERKEAEEALRESSQFNQQIISNAREGIIVYDRELRYVVWNPFMEDLTGIQAKIMLGKRPRDLPAVFQREHAKILITKEAAEGIETNLKRAMAGETFTYLDVPMMFTETGITGWASARYGPYRNAQGEIIGAMAIIRDITERRQLEEQLRHAQKLEAVGQLAGGVAHEFNNILTAVIGNLDLALGKIADESDQRATLTAALEAARRAALLTQQLLTFSHRTVVDRHPLDLGVLAKEVSVLLRQSIDRRIQVAVRPSGTVWAVLADADQMNQVMINLCFNARDSLVERMSAPDHGTRPESWEPRIEIAIENATIDDAYCRFNYDARQGEYVCLSVSDNGFGIDESIRDHIFEPFFTTKEIGRGTGLGLATVYGVLKQHNGWVELVTEKNTGTTFKCYLPRLDRTATPHSAARAEKTVPGGHEAILFVDDQNSIRRLGQTILEQNGYTVTTAENGEQALDIFQREHDRIRLVVLDLTMPGLSGREVLSRLLAIDPKMRILISSGHQIPRDGNELQSMGRIEFIPKPYSPDDLAQSVRALLDRPDAES